MTNHCRIPTKVWRTSAAIWAATVGAARHFALQLTAISRCSSDLGTFHQLHPWLDLRIVYGWRCSIRVAVVVGCAVVVPLTSWVACLEELTVSGQTHTLPGYTLAVTF